MTNPIYTDLKPGEVRFIEFLDNTGLNIKLHNNALSTTRPYIALSYRWAGEPNKSITIDNHPFSIRDNLFDALTTLAPQVRAEECLFWTDAICINQQNIPERNSQVAMMKDIYEKSDRIFAWLGPSSAEIHAGIELMDQLKTDLEREWLTNPTLEGIQGFVNAQHFAFNESTAWKGISKVLLSDYWERTWIYQEASSPVSLDFFCGKDHFGSSHVWPCIYFAEKFQYLDGPDKALFRKMGMGCMAHNMHMARVRRLPGQSVARKLMDLVWEIKSSACGDARDKIYACLGHATDADREPRIKINYERSLVDVYIDLVLFAVENFEVSKLEFLGLAVAPALDSSSRFARQVGDPSLPSWVPDWRRRTRPAQITGRTETGESLYQPYAGMADVKVEQHELVVKATLFENLEIDFVTKLNWETYEPELYRQIALDVISQDSEPATTDIGQMKAIMSRSVTFDRVITEDESSSTAGSWLSTTRRGSNIDWDLIALDPKKTELSRQRQVLRDGMLEAIHAGLLARRLGTTRSGHHGSFPPSTQVRDVVAAFCGSGALHVIRAVSGREHDNVFSYIGECYVDNAMDGQLLDWPEKERREVFVRLV